LGETTSGVGSAGRSFRLQKPRPRVDFDATDCDGSFEGNHAIFIGVEWQGRQGTSARAWFSILTFSMQFWAAAIFLVAFLAKGALAEFEPTRPVFLNVYEKAAVLIDLVHAIVLILCRVEAITVSQSVFGHKDSPH
jgi:hypothetical protein